MKMQYRPTNKTSWQCNSEMCCGRITATFLGVSFGTQRRTVGTSRYIPLRRIGDVPMKRRWVLHFRLVFRRRGDVLMGRRCYVLLRRRHDVPIKCHGDIPLRRLGDVLSRPRWVFHLRRTCDVAGTYRETSLQRRHDVLLQGAKPVQHHFKSKPSASFYICFTF